MRKTCLYHACNKLYWTTDSYQEWCSIKCMRAWRESRSNIEFPSPWNDYLYSDMGNFEPLARYYNVSREDIGEA